MHSLWRLSSLLASLLVSCVRVSGLTSLNVTITKETTVDIPTTLGGGYMWEVSLMQHLHGLFSIHTSFRILTIGQF